MAFISRGQFISIYSQTPWQQRWSMAVFCSKRPRRGGSMKCHGADLGRDKLRHHSERGNCAMVWKVHRWKEWWNHWLSHWWIIDGDIIWINGTWYLYNNIYIYIYTYTYIHYITLHDMTWHYIHTYIYIYTYIYVYIHTNINININIHKHT